jgi:hypothetical protein
VEKRCTRAAVNNLLTSQPWNRINYFIEMGLMHRFVFFMFFIVSKNAFAITAEFAAAVECLGYKNAEHAALTTKASNDPSIKKRLLKVEQESLFLYKKFQKEIDDDEAGGHVVSNLFADKPSKSYAELLNSLSSCKAMPNQENKKECELKMINEWLAIIKKSCELSLRDFK